MPALKILVADDSAAVRTKVRRLLCDEGYEVLEACDGMAAIQMARNAPPALAIVDIEMPRLDGYGVCQILKEMGSPWDEVPIVFLTSRSSHALELLGQQLGAYVRKSTDLENLPEVVNEVMLRKRIPSRGGSIATPGIPAAHAAPG